MDIFLNDRATVSRRHALIFEQNQRWYLKDLGSRNGTFLNGDRLREGEEYPISDRDTISLGASVKISIEIDGDSTLLEETLIEEIEESGSSVTEILSDVEEVGDSRTLPHTQNLL